MVAWFRTANCKPRRGAEIGEVGERVGNAELTAIGQFFRFQSLIEAGDTSAADAALVALEQRAQQLR